MFFITIKYGKSGPGALNKRFQTGNSQSPKRSVEALSSAYYSVGASRKGAKVYVLSEM